MPKLKKLPDQELIRLLKKHKQEVLVALFERNFLDTKLLCEKHEQPDPSAVQVLSSAVTLLWEYFQQNPWKESSHKLDFMVKFTVVELLKVKTQQAIKQKHHFPELLPYIEYLEKEKGDVERLELLGQYLRHMKDKPTQIMQWHSFEKLDDEAIADKLQLGDEEQVETMRYKALAKTINLIRANNSIKNIIR